MSLTSIMSTAVSALSTNQSALKETAQNVANVNNPAYVRRGVVEQAVDYGGEPGGVKVAEVQRMGADFLTSQVLTSRSTSSMFSSMNDIETQLQALFGRPDLATSMPSLINTALTAPAQLTLDPTSDPQRIGYLQNLNAAFGSISDLSSQVSTMRSNTDTNIAQQVTTANNLIQQVWTLNTQIKQSLAETPGGDPDLMDQRSDALRQLSDIMSIRTFNQPDGSVNVTTSDGFALVNSTRTQLTYTPASTTSNSVVYNPIQAVTIDPNTGKPSGQVTNFDQHVVQGGLRGLLTERDVELPNLLQQLGELGAGYADQVNAVHADNVAVPPANSLTGRDTGLLSSDALNFTGQTTLAVVDASGKLVKKIDVDFDAGTLSVNGGAPASFSGSDIGSFVSDLNTALGPDGTASFTNGTLTLAASDPNDGVGFSQPATNGSSRGGRSLAQFFGVNDLVTGPTPTFFATGLSASDQSGFAAGQNFNLVFRGPTGDIAKTFTYTTAAGDTIGDIITKLNDPTTGLGQYMTFALDGSGTMTATPTAQYQGYALDVNGDSTDRGGTGMSFTELFGLGRTFQMQQGQGLAVDPGIMQQPDLLALGQLDTAGANVGDVVATVGDSRGAQALANLSTQPVGFNAAGDLNSVTTTIGDYASLLVANRSSKAASIDQMNTSAGAIQSEVDSRRTATEGVNLDEELSNMVIYQQAYAAAARIITVASQLYDTLTKLGT